MAKKAHRSLAVDARAIRADEARLTRALAAFELAAPALFALWHTVRSPESDQTETTLGRRLGMSRAWVAARLSAGDAFLDLLERRL